MWVSIRSVVCSLTRLSSQELLAQNVPYFECKGDGAVFMAMHGGKLPSQPDISKPNYSELWKICNECWAAQPQGRPTMTQLVRELELLSEVKYELQFELVHTLRQKE